MLQAGLSTVEPFDGVSALWWDSLDAIHSAIEKSSDVTAAREDEKLFIDPSRSVAFVTQEEFVLEPEGSVPYVFMECLRRRSDLDPAAFKKGWVYHQIIARKACEQEVLPGYVQNHTLLGGAGRVQGLYEGEEPFDGVVTAYFDSIARFKALVASPLAAQESFEDEKKFMDHSQSVQMLTRRHVIKDIVR